MNKIMKKLIQSLFVLTMIFSYSTSFAFVSWNGGAGDCPTVSIGNATTGAGINGGSGNCWPYSSITASAGDYVKVHIYFHNTGNSDSTNTKLFLKQQTTGSATSHTFSGSINSDQGSISFGPVMANISSSQTLTYVSSTWRNHTGGQMSFLNGQNGSEILSSGLDLGTVTAAWKDQGSMVILFQVSNTTITPPQAQFTVTTDAVNTSTVTSSSATLSGSYANASAIATWFEYGTNGLNKSTFSIGGSTPFSKSLTGLAPSTTYMYRACASTGFTSKCGQIMYFTTGANNPPPPPPSTTCTIYYFNANPTYILSGNSSSLYWVTNGCTSVSLSSVGAVSTSNTGYTVTPASTTTYTLTATGANNSDVKYTTITVGSVYVPPTTYPCVINSFSASPTYITTGNSSILSWNTNNCTSLYITNIGNVNGNGSYTVYPSTTTTYTLNASGNGGSDTRNAYITVSANNPPPPPSNPTPFVTTYQPNSISQNSAALTGYANGNGGNINAWIEFPCYGTSYGQVNNQSNTNISANVYSLSPNTTYSYCAVAQNINSSQIVRGNVVSFTTNSNYNPNPPQNQGSLPYVSTYSPTNVTTTSATLNGYVDGNYSYTTRWFRYGTSIGALTMTTNSVGHGSSAQNVSDYVYNLSPNTTYYYQTVAQNAYGINYGSVQSFNTNSSLIPIYNNGSTTVVTTVATSVSERSAQINGLLQNTSNLSTNVYFEYGTTAYMGLVTPTKNLGSGTTLPYFETLTGLAPDTIYYYRAVAQNSNGTAKGTIEIFSTTGGVQNTNNNTPTNRTTVVNTVTKIGLESPVMLKIENRYENIGMGDIVDYTVTYKNIGGSTLSHPLLQVILPKYLVYTNSSIGTYEESTRTLSVPLGDLKAQDGGIVYLQGKVVSLPTDNTQIVSTALLIYTTAKNAQENAIAYALNRSKGIFEVKDTNGANLSASAFLAGLGLPGTLIGWLFWLLIILLIILIIRTYFYKKDDKNNHSMHH